MAAPLGAIGGWVLEEKLGEGGMGAVYRARHPANPGRAVALKLMGGKKGDARALARFEREARALAQLDDPGVVKVFASGVENGRPYYVMELVSGRSLGDIVKLDGTLEPARAAALVATVARTVARVHAKGVLHRDLKPDNVLLDADGRTRLVDFGLAWLADAESLTKTGALLGTPAFAAPEQLAGEAKQADERADVYGLGGTLFFALTGRAPFDAPTAVALMAKVVDEPALPPSRFQPGVPRALDAVVLRALEKQPAQRYASATALAEDLERVARGAAPEALSASRFSGIARVGWRLRLPLAAVLVGAVALFVLLAVVKKMSPPEGAADGIEAVKSASPTSDPLEQRAARAYAALAALSAPQRALDDGALDAPVSAATLGDLTAARALPGEPGARAAWLVVDLLALAGRDTEARAALEAARSRPGADARLAEGFERLLAAPLEPRVLGEELAALRHDPRRAPLAARFFARAGAPRAFEHVGAALAATPAERIAAADDLAPFLPVAAAKAAPADLRDQLLRVRRLLDECTLSDKERFGNVSDVLGVVAARAKERRAAIVAALGPILERAPDDPAALDAGADPVLGTLATGVFAVLLARRNLDIQLAEIMSGEDRRSTRAGLSPRPYTDRWDAPTAEELDARLAEDLQSDELVAALGKGGVSEATLADARASVAGLWRGAALAEGVPDSERDRYAAEALVRLESMARLGGPVVLPFRARLRKLVLPEPLGTWLARLDLERAARVALTVDDPGCDVSRFAIFAAGVAAEAPADEALAKRLYSLGVLWAHEQAVYHKVVLDPKGALSIREYLSNRAGDVKNLRAYLGPLRAIVNDAVIDRDFAPTREDEMRLGKAYSFRGPRVR